jgi:hypothetical protein
VCDERSTDFQRHGRIRFEHDNPLPADTTHFAERADDVAFGSEVVQTLLEDDGIEGLVREGKRLIGSDQAEVGVGEALLAFGDLEVE